MSFYMTETIDIETHNAEAKAVWEAFRADKPTRVPVSIVGSISNYMLNPVLNTHGWTFKDYFENPDIQIQAQLEYQRWQRFHVVCDNEMGLPENGWQINLDFQNCYDAAWFGCKLHYIDGQVPDTELFFKDNPGILYDMPEELPYNNGIISRGIEFFEYMHQKCPGMEFEGKPVLPPTNFAGEGMDGPLDLAYKLRGADNLLVDMLVEEQYFHDLMNYITENLIRRIKSLKKLRWDKLPTAPDKDRIKGPYGYADDAMALISTEQYVQYVMPYHRRFLEEFSDGSPTSIHLCGDSTRHFKFLRDNLNIMFFDTGFPVDHGALRKELGPEVQIGGGPTVMTIKYGTAGEVEAETRRICESGVMDGGKFIMIAANNMAPCTPVENVNTLYEATKKYGKY